MKIKVPVGKTIKSLRDEFLCLQGYTCKICKQTNPRGGQWCLDHDANTGEPRGTLCLNCNSGFGFYDENTEYLENAKLYKLEFSKPEPELLNTEADLCPIRGKVTCTDDKIVVGTVVFRDKRIWVCKIHAYIILKVECLWEDLTIDVGSR